MVTAAAAPRPGFSCSAPIELLIKPGKQRVISRYNCQWLKEEEEALGARAGQACAQTAHSSHVSCCILLQIKADKLAITHLKSRAHQHQACAKHKQHGSCGRGGSRRHWPPHQCRLPHQLCDLPKWFNKPLELQAQPGCFQASNGDGTSLQLL